MRVKLTNGVEDGIDRAVTLGGAGTEFRADPEREFGRGRYVLAGRDFQPLHLDGVAPAQDGIVNQRDDIGIKDMFFLVREILEAAERVLQRVVAQHITQGGQFVAKGVPAG